MTAAPPAGAAPHELTNWHAINWPTVHQHVRRLQARIVKATQEGRWGKVKALQRLLTHSFSGKVLAVKRVTENQGKRTPGIDGAIWTTPQQKAQAIPLLRQRGYRPRPARRVYIPKKNGKKRPLGILTMRDRAMQALYYLALAPIAETTADPNSYGFRPERSTADAIEKCFRVLGWKRSAVWVLEGDIKACFDGISHAWLEAHVPLDRAILHRWLKAGYMERHVLLPTDAGTPQGGIVSPVLANLALDGLERLLQTYLPKTTDRGKQAKINLIRYADDFIITGHSQELLEKEVKPLVAQFLRARGLELSEEKTRITHIEDGFDFLGQTIRKYGTKLLITPSKKNVLAFLEKVRTLIKINKQTPAASLIRLLNPVIRGWAQYHQHVVSKATFHAVDHAIFQAMWRWAQRRHPSKSKGWIKRKYVRTVGGRDWVFCGEADGQVVHLYRAYRTPIRRHKAINAEANPYDRQWEPYFEQRLGVKMEAKLQGRRYLLRLWKEQQGICPVCKQPITEITGWHTHHIIWRSLGGPDTLENRVLLHPNCHMQVHSQKVSVEKPRPAGGEGEA